LLAWHAVLARVVGLLVVMTDYRDLVPAVVRDPKISLDRFKPTRQLMAIRQAYKVSSDLRRLVEARAVLHCQ
jgi:hypothetical protein